MNVGASPLAGRTLGHNAMSLRGKLDCPSPFFKSTWYHVAITDDSSSALLFCSAKDH